MIRATQAGLWTAALLLSGGAYAAQEPSPEVRREEQHWQQKQERQAEKDMQGAQQMPSDAQGFELNQLRREDVRKIQSTLSKQGFYDGPTDGQATPATIAALGAFQVKRQLQATGRLDARTADQLGLKVASLERTEVQPTTARLEATDLGKLSREEVTEVQRTLREQGLYRGEVDGIVTPALTAALGAFQSQQQIAVTGRLDRRTAGALGIQVGVRGEGEFLEFGDLTPEQRMQVQRSLKKAGLYEGAIDGRFGPGTQQALRKFQSAHDIPVTGRLDYKTAQMLEIEGVQEVQPVRGGGEVEDQPMQPQQQPTNDQLQEQPPTPEQERQGGTPQGQPEGR